MKTEFTPNEDYYKANDNHFYKVLKSGYVLHVEYANGCMNILSPAVWEDVVEMTTNAHAPLTKITKEQFEKKAKATLITITSSLYDN